MNNKQIILRYAKENNLTIKKNNGRFNNNNKNLLLLFYKMIDFEKTNYNGVVRRFQNFMLIVRYKQTIMTNGNKNHLPLYDDYDDIIAFVTYYSMEMNKLTRYFFKKKLLVNNDYDKLNVNDKINLIKNYIHEKDIYFIVPFTKYSQINVHINNYKILIISIINGIHTIDMNNIRQ